MHALTLALVLLGPAAAPPSGDGEVARLIEQLGDDSQPKREEAETQLKRLGRAAISRLLVAAKHHSDLEIRMRALRAARVIDPTVLKRLELEGLRAALLVKVNEAATRAFDARRWGEDVPNPFTHITPEGRKRLEAEGVEVGKLLKMRAVLITGSYCGANGVRLVNRDPNTIVILGNGFITHTGVYSAGPVLAVANAHIMGSVTAAGPAWFVEKSWPRCATVAAPLLCTKDTWAPHDAQVKPIRGDFGWRRPPGWLDAPKWKAGANLPPLYIDDVVKKRAALLKEIQAATGTDVKGLVKPTENPFKGLSEEGKARLRKRGIDPGRLAKLKAVRIEGDHWKHSALVQRDPNIVLVIGKKFLASGNVLSAGPIVAVEDAHFMCNVTGADVVWFADESFPRGRSRGLPVIVTTTASRSQMSPNWEDTWRGDYGWKPTLSEKAAGERKREMKRLMKVP
jgi:hypothetical protein